MSEEMKTLSLADFATASTDDVAIVMSRLPAAGSFLVQGTSVEVKMMEPRNPEDQARISITHVHTILEANPMDEDKDPESFVGKTIYQNTTLWPDTFAEALGLMKGNYKRIGLSPAGNPGGVPGQQEGWLDAIIDWPFEVKVRHVTGRNDGVERAYFDWKAAPEEVFASLGIVRDQDGDDTAAA